MQFTHQTQSQGQKQGFYLSMQHMQLMHLLHLSGYALDEYLQNQLEENPLLELSDKSEDWDEDNSEKDKPEVYDEDFFQEDYSSDYDDKMYSPPPSDEDYYEAPVVQQESFTDQLKEQLDLMNITGEQKKLAKYIVDELEDDGYLKRSNLDIGNDYSFRYGKLVEDEDIEDAIRIIQDCEPAGIGARSLQECLLLQLNSKSKTCPVVQLTKNILQNYYDKFVNRNFAVIISALSISEETFKQVLQLIQTLSPKPNTSIDKYEQFKNQITPSFEISFDGNEFSVAIVNSKYGNLTVNQNIEELTKKEGKKVNKPEQKYWTKIATEANCLVEAIKQREKTMMAVIKSILKIQVEFFKHGDKKLLKPMILEQVATLSGCDISTVSRITSNKYVQTSYGCFLLKNLFSSSLQSNEEDVSSHKVKELIEEIIKNENKKTPYTDNQIVDSLKGMGISIARRTVVKYRDTLGISNYSLRTG